jgi:hypothetical protein
VAAPRPDAQSRLRATIWPEDEAPTGIAFVGYENPPGVNSPQERIESFLASDRATWYNHVNIAAHPHGGHGDPATVPVSLLRAGAR